MEKFLKEILTLAAELQGAKGFNAVMIANDIEMAYNRHIAEIKGEAGPKPSPPECDHDFGFYLVDSPDTLKFLRLLNVKKGIRKCRKCGVTKPLADDDIRWAFQPMPEFDEDRKDEKIEPPPKHESN